MFISRIAKDKYYAHSDNSDTKDNWQLLSVHLKNVANLALKHMEGTNLNEIAFAAGLLHDAGKYSAAFQKRLEGATSKVDHSTAGAKIAAEKYGAIGKLMAYAICGHHGGMPDAFDEGFDSICSSLSIRLKAQTELISAFSEEIELPERINIFKLKSASMMGFRLAFYTRMLFSALVDADYLDTENYYNTQAAMLRSKWKDLGQLHEIFFAHMARIRKEAEQTHINLKRNEIFNECVKAAEAKNGLFSLSVPTGGGKTYSSMAFALEHAKLHGLRRIIYAIPFTSIIEQNANVFREIFGDNAVLEHHSNYAFEDNDESIEKLAAENWDAPIVVTTNVQLFESLFSNKPSRCRKLHNLMRSVIILDEVQTLPDGLIKPCLAALQCLCSDFGTTVVMCSATQPAIEKAWPEIGRVHEIIPDPPKLYEAFRKVDVINLGKLEDEALVEQLDKCNQVLCIVNTRKHAKKYMN